MFSPWWMRSLLRRLRACPSTRKPRTPRRVRRTHLVLEVLEDRVTPSVTVTTTQDLSTPVAGQLSLREAINMVNAGQVADNTIILSAGTYQNTQGALNITHSLILQGAGSGTTILDGGGTDRVILIDPIAAVNVQFSGLTVQNGNTNGDGGGINVLDVSGQSSTLTVQNCIITANTAEMSAFGGGGIFANNGDIVVSNSQITNNQSSFAGGGIADNNQGTGNVTITNSLIADNTAGFEGGGIALVNAGPGALTVTGSTIKGNSVTSTITPLGGGGIFANTNGAVNIGNTTIEGNTSTFNGGGFEEQQHGPTSIVFSNDTIATNQTTMGNGGGIDVSTGSNVTIQNTTLSGNTAAGNGGGISDTGTGALDVESSTFVGNTAANGGGLEDDSIAMLTVMNSTFDRNQANAASGQGGGIDTRVHANMFNDTFTNNSSGTGGGGAVFESGGGTTQLVSCLFLNNTSSADGGAVLGTMNDLMILDSLFTGNSAGGDGGGIFTDGVVAGITNSTLSNNQATGRGGAVFIGTTDTINQNDEGSELENDTLTGNGAGGDGGAVLSAGVGDLGLFQVTINGNRSGGNGGGIAYIGNQQMYFVQNSLIALDAATGNGPDVFTASSLTVTDDGGNFIGTLSGSSGFGGGTLTGNPLLGPLQNNGGMLAGASADQQVVQTEALLPGSPAIGKGIANGATTDERGFPVVTPRDIGAFQFQNVPLTVTVTPATPSLTINGTEGFTITDTNTGGTALPADNSMLTITLSAGLTTTNPLTFTLAALPAGQSRIFTVATTATTPGSQMLTATVTSPDANPNSVSSSAAISVVAPPPPPTTTHTPIGSLTLFAFGFGPTGIDLFEVDSAGDIFAVPFMGGGGPLFLNTTLQLPIAVAADGQLLALLAGSNGQDFIIDIINPFNPFIEPVVIAALTRR